MSETAAPPASRSLTVTDVVCGVPLVVLAVVATCSLALAHAGRHTPGAVLGTCAVTLAALAVPARRIRVRADHAGLAAVLGSGLLAAVMFLPGFSYGVGDKDPGNYAAHAVQIAREGSYAFTDPALAHPTLPVALNPEDDRVSAMWIDDARTGRIVPQFFHLWPALLATSYDVAGYGGLTATAPLISVLAVMLFAATLRRVGGTAAAWVGGVLLATNMTEVWQAKTPSTEILAQALFLGALLAVVVAAQERWRPAAAIAGALTGVGFLNRADAWVLVLLAAVVLAAVWVSRRADGEARWGAAGLAVVLPYALWQAYGPAGTYSRHNGVPGLRPTLFLLGAVAAAGLAGRLTLRRRVEVPPWLQRRAGLAVCVLALALLVAGFLRPVLTAPPFLEVSGRHVRSYDDLNLYRLSWFVQLPAFGLAALGLALVALRPWRVAAWAVALPTLALLPLYAYRARAAPQLMWWTRRFVPHVVPGLIVLVALALAYGIELRWGARRPLRVPALLAAALLTAEYLSMSLPLRTHDEWAGSFAVSARLSALSGSARGVYLWQQPEPGTVGGATLWASPVWLERAELSVLLPTDAAALAGYVRSYRSAFPDDPVFVLWDGTALPAALAPLGLSAVDHLTGSLPKWEESYLRVPRHARPEPYDFTVYAVR